MGAGAFGSKKGLGAGAAGVGVEVAGVASLAGSAATAKAAKQSRASERMGLLIKHRGRG